jgi:hypothetical protein
MVGPDGKIYAIPANYASKSKLVEGDLLKLTIRTDGSFIYKQIGPVPRKRVVGVLVHDATTGEYVVLIDHKAYKVILASITYFKGQPGDEVVLLIPEAGDSSWGAVENVVRAGQGNASLTETLELSGGAAAQMSSGSEAELPVGDAGELPMGDVAELPDGAMAELPSGEAAELTSGTV